MSIANLKYLLLLFVLGVTLGGALGFGQRENVVEAYRPEDVCDEMEFTVPYLHPLSELNGQGYATVQECYSQNVPFVPDCTSTCTYEYGCQCKPECKQDIAEKNETCGGSTGGVSPTPTPTATPTPKPPSPSPSPTLNPSIIPLPASPSPTPPATRTPTATPSPTLGVSPSPVVSVVPTPSVGVTPSPLASFSPGVTPSPFTPLTSPDLGPICAGIEMVPVQPEVGESAIFVCKRVAGVLAYDFRVKLPNGTVQNLAKVATDGTVNGQSQSFLIAQAGTYSVQCRPCRTFSDELSCGEFEAW